MLATAPAPAICRGSAAQASVVANGFPPFLPKEVEMIRDPSARELAKRIQRLPVKVRARSLERNEMLCSVSRRSRLNRNSSNLKAKA